MKNLTCVLSLLSLLVISSCTQKQEKKYQNPKTTVIAGKILNFDPRDPDLHVSVNRPGFSQLRVDAEVDSAGNFSASFKSYIPTDTWVAYKTNFLVLTRPGDSIYVAFDGTPKNRPEILKTIKFSGDSQKMNQDAASFQNMFFSNPLYTDWDGKEKAVKEYDVDEYILYMDTTRQKMRSLYDRFVKETSPDELTKIWAKTTVEGDYYNFLSWYPDQHIQANNLKPDEWKVPDNYYDFQLEVLPVTDSMLISGYSLSGLVNQFHYGYAEAKWKEEWESINTNENPSIGVTPMTAKIYDSLSINGIVKHTSDSLLRQLILTEHFVQGLNRYSVENFEKYRQVIDSHIKEPFLIEPLLEKYHQLKKQLEAPRLATNAMLKKLNNSSAKLVVDSIFSSNKDKVIYIDVWATWCAPCISEMPRSKKLMKQMNDKDVAFVYLCIDSEENRWKAALDDLQLGGQHYFMTGEQSKDIRKMLEINGVPHYVLVDRAGVITEKGSHLRPYAVKNKIEELLQ